MDITPEQVEKLLTDSLVRLEELYKNVSLSVLVTNSVSELIHRMDELEGNLSRLEAQIIDIQYDLLAKDQTIEKLGG